MSSTGVSARTSSGSCHPTKPTRPWCSRPTDSSRKTTPKRSTIRSWPRTATSRCGARPRGRRGGGRRTAPGTSREDLDLVRVYLKHVGKRKLLKASEEQEIGERIEKARGELQAMLGMIPCAVRTMLALADEVRKGAPAAELILLPDGGELKQDSIAPVLKAWRRSGRPGKRVDDCIRKCEDSARRHRLAGRIPAGDRGRRPGDRQRSCASCRSGLR